MKKVSRTELISNKKNIKLILLIFISAVFSVIIINLAQTANGDNTYQTNNFNIAVASDWGCNEDAKKTSENIQNHNAELVIAGGDLSYEASADCWFKIISPFKSKLKVSLGDHEYHETTGGIQGVLENYLKPLHIQKTYYSFDINKVHIIAMDPYIDYGTNSDQYQFIESDLKKVSQNPKIDWIFVIEHIPMYTSPSEHPADVTIRDTYHNLFDKYGVDLVFSGDNHNYQRTFPLKYNNNGDNSNPIVSNKNTNDYNNDDGVIYIISGTAGRSHYAIKEQSSFVSKQDDKNFGFLNIDIKSDKTLTASFYANEDSFNNDKNNKNVIDRFTISKMT